MNVLVKLPDPSPTAHVRLPAATAGSKTVTRALISPVGSAIRNAGCATLSGPFSPAQGPHQGRIEEELRVSAHIPIGSTIEGHGHQPGSTAACIPNLLQDLGKLL